MNLARVSKGISNFPSNNFTRKTVNVLFVWCAN